MSALLVRHGQSQANVDEVFDGQRVNSPLTIQGEEDARKTGERLRGSGITKIVSSPLQRATKTAQIISEIIGVSNVIIEPRIAEHDKGDLSGQSWDKVTDKEILNAEGAEDPEMFAKRIVAGLRAHDSPDQKVLFVAHGGVASMVTTIMEHGDLKRHNSVLGMRNGDLMEIDTDELAKRFTNY